MQIKKFQLLSIAFLILLAGCAEPPAPSNQWAQVSQGTIEGKTAHAMYVHLPRADECSVQKFSSVTNLARNFLGEEVAVAMPQTDNEIREAINDAVECNIQLWRDVEGNGNIRRVNYWATINDNCRYFDDIGEPLRNYRLVIEADTSSGTARVVEGAMPEEKKSEAEQYYPVLNVVGECTAPVILNADLVTELLGLEGEELID